PALARHVYRPVVPAEPLVEAVYLNRGGRRSVALINWCYVRSEQEQRRRASDVRTAENLRIDLPGVDNLRSIRSLAHGDLKIAGEGSERHVVLPNLKEIDLLIVE